MEKKDLQPTRLREILERSLQRLDLSGKLTEYGVWPIWNETVGPTIARNAQPEKIRQGILFVKVASPTWMQQLHYMKEMIREKLNQRLEKEVVKTIFFVVGKVEAEKSPTGIQGPSPHTLAPGEVRLDEEQLRSIRDPEIRRALKRLFTAQSKGGKR